MFNKPQKLVQKLVLKGLTEQRIAEKANISQSTVNRIKSGYILYPRFETVEKLEKVFQQLSGK